MQEERGGTEWSKKSFFFLFTYFYNSSLSFLFFAFCLIFAFLLNYSLVSILNFEVRKRFSIQRSAKVWLNVLVFLMSNVSNGRFDFSFLISIKMHLPEYFGSLMRLLKTLQIPTPDESIDNFGENRCYI